MLLDYSKIEFDSCGRPEVPELVLQTLGRESIGIITDVSNLKLSIKFSEPSEISFTIPSKNNGIANPIHNSVSGYKIIYTEKYGIYVIMNPETDADGISETKEVRGYSLEKLLDNKRFYLEEGTFNFWNPASQNNTVIGRILEIATGWSIGYVSPSLIGRYRTFDSVDEYLLSFIYNDLPDKYRCVFAFDPYNMTINVYDADEERSTLPIYLSFDNLVQHLTVEEISDELVTAIRPYGADGLDIRGVNPIGTNWIYDLSYFIESGDISGALANKWNAWQRSILNNQSLYKGLVGLRASSTARLLTEQAALVDLKGQLTDLTNQQSITIQALALETTSAGKASQQQALDQINSKISAKEVEIANKESDIRSIEQDLDETISSSYSGRIKAITDSLSFSSYFTKAEQNVLSQYFIEQDITESTFVATDVNTSLSGNSYQYGTGSVSISGANILEVNLTSTLNKRMFTISGGTFSTTGGMSVNGDIIRGTLEVFGAGKFVMSMYAGSISSNGTAAPSGMITISGNISGLSTDVSQITKDGITTYEGSRLQFNISSASLYLTANVSEYQKYSVQMELFDYAVGILNDLATPTYEFSVDSANFIFAQEFAPFRNKLELGKAVYLQMNDDEVITPIIIEFELDFEDRDSFSVVFSNRFKRHDSVNTLKDMIETSYSTGKSFDASKYIYNQTVGQACEVSKFMQSSLDAAVNSILAASNQSVVIDGAGIHVGGNSNYNLRVIDSMIAMTDDNWATSKLAIGLFATKESGTYFGVNAEVIGGKLIVGNTLIIENKNDSGVMQFKVDATGAWLYNASYVMQHDNGGLMILDPKYGIIAGSGLLFNTNGTTVTPEFIDNQGNITFDSDGMPQNANFYLDLRDGNAYFRGKVKAESGSIGGWNLAADQLWSGSGNTFVSLNSSKAANSPYAIWAGDTDPTRAKFSVKRDGTMYAGKGIFSGTVKAASYQDLNGNNMMTSDYKFNPDYLELKGLNVNDNFIVDENGAVSITGTITMNGGSIKWSEIDETESDSYKKAEEAAETASDAAGAAEDAAEAASDAAKLAKKIADGEYSGGTFIDGTSIYSPNIYANHFSVIPRSEDDTTEDSPCSYSLYGYFLGQLREMLNISYYYAGVEPRVVFKSPCSAYATWGFGNTSFSGYVDFSGATVTGIAATFG